ncbi:MAG TPA: acylphosphatase [Noviherbaspirillum sp.]|jgi:acylphosphatase|uniref:acylphosphatase n=1 Tax=Noviherbaspirillum sp. TaxID=1926288 RepID=UPI002F94771E
MAKHLRITGRVQGVGYRASFEAQAKALGLSGWVRNRRDGSVEALVDGDVQALAQIVEWARRGPPAARVEAVEESERTPGADSTPAPGDREGFTVLPTA